MGCSDPLDFNIVSFSNHKIIIRLFPSACLNFTFVCQLTQLNTMSWKRRLIAQLCNDVKQISDGIIAMSFYYNWIDSCDCFLSKVTEKLAEVLILSGEMLRDIFSCSIILKHQLCRVKHLPGRFLGVLAECLYCTNVKASVLTGGRRKAMAEESRCMKKLELMMRQMAHGLLSRHCTI